MDLLLEEIKCGHLPKDVMQNLLPANEKGQKVAIQGLERFGEIVSGVISNCNDSLYKSAMYLLEEYSDLEDEELEELVSSAEEGNYTYLAKEFSSFKDLVVSHKGIRALTANWSSGVAFTYLSSDGLLYLHDLVQNRDLGAIKLGSSSRKAFENLKGYLLGELPFRVIVASGVGDIFM